jgi:hypothetical protein
MHVARVCALAAAGLALGSAASESSAQSRRFDGTWRVEFSGNRFCYAPYGTVRWTIRKGVVSIPRGYRGTVDERGRVRMRYPGPYFGKMNAVVARLSGNAGTGSVEVEATRCRSTIKIARERR